MTRLDSFSEAKELRRLDDPMVQQRCVKLKRKSTAQVILLGTMWVLLFTGVLLLTQSLGGRSRSGRYHPPNPALVPYGDATLVLALASLAGFLCCRNYYLADPSERCLYHHFQFLWWRRRRTVYRQGEVLAVTAAGRKKSSRYGAYWQHRLTAVAINGEQEPLSDWRRHGLELWNAEARTLARVLGCQSISAPPESTLAIELKGGKPVIQFDHPRSLFERLAG